LTAQYRIAPNPASLNGISPMPQDDAKLEFASPPPRIDVGELEFYHSMDVPGLGYRQGEWDLRSGLDAYLGGVDFGGKSVLDIGASDGFVAFEIERRGARVVTIDLGVGETFDLFPYHAEPTRQFRSRMANRIRRTRAAFWYVHHALRSTVKLVESHAGSLCAGLVGFDVMFAGNVLQHLRNPIDFLIDASRRAATVILTEADWRGMIDEKRPVMEFFDREIKSGRPASWFNLSPALVKSVLECCGMAVEQPTTHFQRYLPDATAEPMSVPHFTVLARRQ
jgi:SAM-dependent methyltransferase